jgi:hypothetical protein
MKICEKCKLAKNETEFYKHKRRKDGLQTSCISCNNQRSKEHYKKNKSTYLAGNIRRKKINTEWLKQYKESQPCTDCKQQYPYYVMDFDHLRDKKDNISKLLASKSILLSEIEKCELVCANCHRIRTHKRKFDV